ncbi:MAG: CHAT domain-containing protein [Chloroflexi bacterium]|nr:CHAT domain-containing protein [Chloroflexota bacterium]
MPERGEPGSRAEATGPEPSVSISDTAAVSEPSLDALRERWAARAREVEGCYQTDPHAGVALAEAWQAEEAGGEGQARALRAAAYALRTAGLYERAEPCFTEAEAAFDALGLRDDAARTRIGHVEALRYLARYDEAVALAHRNLEYLRSRGPAFGLDVARQTINLGLVCWRRGDLEEALRCFSDARDYGRKERIRELAATASMNIGLVLNELGRFGEALKADLSAVKDFQALNARERLATVQMNLGLLHISRGEYGQALEALLASRALCEELGLDRKRAAVDVDLTRAYRALNLATEAAESVAHAVATFRANDMPFELGTSLLLSGQVAELRGDLATARQELAESRAFYARIGNAVWETIAQLAGLRLAAIEATLGQLPVLLDEVREVAARLEPLGAPEHAANAHLLAGEIQARLGNLRGAQADLQAALALGARLGSDAVLSQAHEAEGTLLEANAPDEARASYEQAVIHLERLRARARADDLKLAVVGGAGASAESLYERIARLLLGPVTTYCESCAPHYHRATAKRGRDAFRWLERGKSRGLLEDALGKQPNAATVSPRLRRARERVAELRARLNAAYTEQYALETPAARGAAAPIVDLERTERELSRATRELQILMRGDGAVDITALIDVGRVQAALDERTCLVEYVVLGDEIACFVVRREHFAVFRNLGTRTQAEKALSWFWFHIRKGTYGAEFLRANQRSLARAIDQALQQLGELLVAPLAGALADSDHLVVVPHSLLHGVPLHALPYAQAMLLDQLTVSYAPSAAVFAATAGRPSPAIERPLIVAPDIADLPWVQDEARRIAEQLPGALILSGRDATLERVRHESRDRDSLHLATHGVFRADNPTYSALELADGWLSVGELAELSRGQQLVCLSACHTAVSGVGPGDELLGLTRAVLGSGVGALVASLWAANDDTAPAFMTAFYRGLRNGQSRAASLRAAALSTRSREPHPYFWAPFILVGAP